MFVPVFKIACCLMFFTLSAVAPAKSIAAPFKVLVVMSYEQTFPWCREIRMGIDDVLSNSSEITYFYMNTKLDFEAGAQKAEEAYGLFQTIRPDGVIAADDNAQSMFVVPYLKNKVETPVMFCGVNAAPQEYGYPARNVSGILERLHINESIAFVQQLVPSIQSVGFIAKDSPAIHAVFNQVQGEYASYSAKFIGFKMSKTKQETLSIVKNFRSHCDLLFVEALQGITDAEGNALEDRSVIPLVADVFGKPVIGSNTYAVQFGALCAVVKTGQEQGATAARMLRLAMRGTPVDRIAVTTNKYGKRIINVTTMKKLGIKPKPIVLQGVELVRTQKQ